MSDYRIVVSLTPVPQGGGYRGSSTCQHTHWVSSISDDSALACGVLIRNYIANSPIEKRWTAVRGVPAHSVRIERWGELGRQAVIEELPMAFAEVDSIELPLPGSIATASFQACWPFTHTRGAILVELGNALGKRRCYVGPVSPRFVWTETGVGPLTISSIIEDPRTFDDLPVTIENGTVDLWTQDFANLGAEYMKGISDAMGANGTLCVRVGTALSYVRYARASRVRAELRSRSMRADWADEIELP